MNVLTESMFAHEDLFPPEKAALEIRPIHSMISMLQIDHRSIAQFVRTDLADDFGSSTLKIWRKAMIMRGESTQVQDALFDAIVREWDVPDTPSRVALDCLDRVQMRKAWRK
jgi:hypothetical protein